MKRIVQNLLAVFLLAVLLVPVTALGAETECEHVMPEKAEWTWTWLPPPGEGYARYTMTVRCEKCNKVLYERNGGSVPAYKVKNATCTDDEIWEYRIQYPLNGKTYTGTKKVEKEGTATGRHFPIPDKGKPATCTEPGLTEGSHCDYCKMVLVAQDVIPASGHLDVRVSKLEQAATCTQDGWTRETKCQNCKQIIDKSVPIKATGHTEVTDAAVAPTCTETGLKAGSHCSVCKEVLKEQEVIPALGHTVVADAAVEPTCTEDGWSGGGQPL